MTDERNIDLLKKLKALAERGVGGEKETAARKLAALMEKYGVTDADLSDDVIDDYDFVYKDPYQKKILHQLFYKVNHERDIFHYTRGKGKRSVLIFRGTAAEALQIRIEYEFYCDLWAEEVDFFMECFIQKHRIFRDDPDAPCDEISRADAFRMAQITAGMQDKQLIQRLEAGKDA